MKHSWIVGALGVALGAGCAGADEATLDLESGFGAYGLTESVPGLSFYPPFVPAVTQSGPADSTMLSSLTVRLLRSDDGGFDATVATFHQSSSPPLVYKADRELYFVDVRAADYFTQRGSSYRFSVTSPSGAELGFVDVPEQIFGFIDRHPALLVGFKLRVERLAVERDGDGLLDWQDNCPSVANGSQVDTDEDGIGDACECLDVTCGEPADECHIAGVCSPATGACSSPPAADGTACTIPGGQGRCEGGTCVRVSSCQNGVRDGGEVGVDCGGAFCPPCIPLGSAPERPAPACSNILFAGASVGDGIYWIDPDGGAASNAYPAYCDMTTDGGGWTLVAYAGSSANGFPRMDLDVGEYDPTLRHGRASKSAVPVARRSNQVVLAYAPAINWAGTLGQSSDAVAFEIPNPREVDLAPENNHGTCTAVQAWRIRPSGSTAACVGHSGETALATSASNCNPAGDRYHAGVWSNSLGGTYGYFAYGLFTTEYSCNSWPNISHHYWVDAQYYNWEPSATMHWPGTTDGSTSIWFRCSEDGACPTCDDGVQNQGEDGVDCGWPCGACGPFNTPETAGADCTALLGAGTANSDGLYYVDPNGAPHDDAYLAHCDMTTDGGGWTLAAYAGSNTAGFPRMDVDVGEYDPLLPAGKASRSAVPLARRSREMALAYSPRRDFTGSMNEMTDAVSFVIPNPGEVDLRQDTNSGACVGVSTKRLRPEGSTAACVGSTSQSTIATSEHDCNPRDQSSHAGVWSRSLGGTYNSFAYGLFTTEHSCNSWPNVSHHWWVDTQYYNWEPSATMAWSGAIDGSASVWFRGDITAHACTDGLRNNGETGVDCGGGCAACPTCFDGLQNQHETAVDCGGECGPCPFNSRDDARASCTGILLSGESIGSGPYFIDPDGGSTDNAYAAFCDMITDGGGWTLAAYAGSNEHGFPRMDVDSGAYHAYLRGGKASRSAVTLARGSTEMALAYTPALASPAALSEMSDVVAFHIPDPASVDLIPGSYGTCSAVVARRLAPSGSTAACVGSTPGSSTSHSTESCNPANRSAHAGVWSRSLGGTYSSFAYGLFTTEYSCNSWPNISHHYWVDTLYANWEPSATMAWPGSVDGSASVWFRGDISSGLNTRGEALASCRAIRDAGQSAGDGVYWIDPDGGGPAGAHRTYCDMTTDGGGWTLVAYAATNEVGFPRMDADTGVFLPDRRVNRASRSAVQLARAANEVALAYAPALEHSGSLGSASDVVAFQIPDPSIVDFIPASNAGTCTAVQARRLRPAGSSAICVGDSRTGAAGVYGVSCNPNDGSSHAGVWSRSLGGTYGSFAYGLFTTEYGCNSWPNVSHHFWVDAQSYNWQPSATVSYPSSVDGATSVWVR